MTRSIMVAISDNYAIGKDNDLIWNMPADLAYFKQVTKGHFVIMGRLSFESLGGKSLPGRVNIIVTRNREYRKENCLVFHSLEDALAAGDQHKQEEVFILGGGKIYAEALDKGLVNRMYITEIHGEFEGDTYFPRFDRSTWEEVKREDHEADEQNPYPYTFVVYEKK